MIPSSSSSISRPDSRAQDRPSSSAARRPLSAAGRPISSASVRKTPASYLLNRPSSSASTRFPARPSSRASTRLSTRLLPLYQQLVSQVTGLDPEKNVEGFQTTVDYVSKNLEFSSKAGPSMDMATASRRIRGLVFRVVHVRANLDDYCRLAEKARIQSNDTLATALQISLNRLNDHIKEMEHDLDHDIKVHPHSTLSHDPSNSARPHISQIISRISSTCRRLRLVQHSTTPMTFCTSSPTPSFLILA